MAQNADLEEADGVAFADRSGIAEQPWLKYTHWRRRALLLILFLVSASSTIDYYIISVTLEPIKGEFGVSDTVLGLLSGACFSLIYAIAGLPIARWADRGNRRAIITISLAGWSIMTMACGAARNVWQLALARFGQGLVEPGALPTANSLIADYYPPENRCLAVSILNASSAVGWLAGISLGGYLAATLGWRAAFFVAGVSGLVLAVFTQSFLDEPRRAMHFVDAPAQESMWGTLRSLFRKRTYVWALSGLALYSVFNFGMTIFAPSFMIRALHANLKEISTSWSVAVSIANFGGAIVGGRLADRLGRSKPNLYALLPTLSFILAAPLYVAALFARDLGTFIRWDVLAEATLAAGLFSSFAVLHAVCGGKRRATAIALVVFAMTLVGGGLGPLLVGLLSDLFQVQSGTDSLRYSLLISVTFLLAGAAVFYRSSRTLVAEVES